MLILDGCTLEASSKREHGPVRLYGRQLDRETGMQLVHPHGQPRRAIGVRDAARKFLLGQEDAERREVDGGGDRRLGTPVLQHGDTLMSALEPGPLCVRSYRQENTH